MSSSVFDLPGLEAAKRALRGLWSRGSGVHAVLLYGDRRSAMPAVASAAARAWLCPKAGSEGACGVCAVCRAYDAGRAVDFQHVQPSGAGGMITINTIVPQDGAKDDAATVPLTRFFRTPPLLAKTKVAWFDPADRMNSRAANAMLKTLEEPTPTGRILLTTEVLGRVLPTIRSRCLCVPCEAAPGSGEQALGPEALVAVLDSALEAPVGGALLLAERFREAAEGLSPDGARASNAEAMRVAAEWAARRMPDRPEVAQAFVEGHRLVLGNVNAGAVVDSLFCELALVRKEVRR